MCGSQDQIFGFEIFKSKPILTLKSETLKGYDFQGIEDPKILSKVHFFRERVLVYRFLKIIVLDMEPLHNVNANTTTSFLAGFRCPSK